MYRINRSSGTDGPPVTFQTDPRNKAATRRATYEHDRKIAKNRERERERPREKDKKREGERKKNRLRTAFREKSFFAFTRTDGREYYVYPNEKLIVFGPRQRRTRTRNPSRFRPMPSINIYVFFFFYNHDANEKRTFGPRSLDENNFRLARNGKKSMENDRIGQRVVRNGTKTVKSDFLPHIIIYD